MHRPVKFIPLAFVLMLLVAAPVWADQPGPESREALATSPAGVVSGQVFNDANGNGLVDDGPLALCNVFVTLEGSGLPAQQVTPSADAYGYCDSEQVVPGPYAFELAGLSAGDYRLVVTAPDTYVATLPTSQEVTVRNNSATSGVAFGMSWPMTVQGTAWQDLNGNGSRDDFNGVVEPVLAGALVEVNRDLDASGTVNLGDVLIGADETDAAGWYSISGLPPGLHLIRVLAAGGSQSSPNPLPIVSGEVQGTQEANIGAQPTMLFGAVWKDVDGDGSIDAGETPLVGAQVTLTGDVDGDGSLETITDDADGLGGYEFPGLAIGNYMLDVVSGVPAGLVAESMLPLAVTLNSGATRQNIGFYDPLNVAVLRPSEWNRECKQVGRPSYSQKEMNELVAMVTNASLVFDEVGLDACAALKSAKGGDLGRATKHDAALQLNLAAGRLLPLTPVNLPELTSAGTVADAAAVVEGLILTGDKEDAKLAAEIAEAINNGKGTGYGMQGSARLAQASYKGKDATSPLRSSGGALDMQLNEMAYLTKWSPGTLGASTNVLSTQIRVKVQTFFDGGVLEVWQVLPGGTPVLLGTAVPTVWNKDVNAVFTFDVWRAATVGELASTAFRLVVRDPDNDGGHVEHAKVDYAELRFDY